MKHHFGDALDREGDYWTLVPNRERYAYRIDDIPVGSEQITIATIGSGDDLWRNVFTFPRLEELTLHESSDDQLLAISELSILKRLRITHARPREIDFISSLFNLEELVLEYVSGFSDLAPLQSLNKLRAIHFENLRRVHNFNGLSGLGSLKYLCIDGTLDWKQPIADFEFLRGLPRYTSQQLHPDCDPHGRHVQDRGQWRSVTLNTAGPSWDDLALCSVVSFWPLPGE